MIVCNHLLSEDPPVSCDRSALFTSCVDGPVCTLHRCDCHRDDPYLSAEARAVNLEDLWSAEERPDDPEIEALADIANSGSPVNGVLDVDSIRAARQAQILRRGPPENLDK